MHVIHVKWCFPVGGAETALIDIMNEQVKFCNVTLVVLNDKAYGPYLNALDRRIAIRCIRRRPGSRNPWPILKMNHLLWCLRPDIVHCHETSMTAPLRCLWLPKVLTIHNTRVDVRYPLESMREVYALSTSIADDIRTRRPRVVPVVMWSGVDVALIRTRTEAFDSRRRRLVQIGRLVHEQKGQDILLRAVQRLVRGGHTGLSVAFIGDGASRQFLTTLRNELGLQKHCQFLGDLPREYVYEHLREYDLLVQPSRFEGFGLTVAEGIAAGLPVLVSNVEGPMEIIERGQHGYVFPAGDATACASAIEDVFAECETDEFQKARAAARESIVQRCSIGAVAHAYLERYAAVVDRYHAV